MLAPEIKRIINEQRCFIATVSKQGLPNIVPKGTMRILNNGELVYAEIFAQEFNTAVGPFLSQPI